MQLYRLRKDGVLRGYKFKGFKTTFYYISEINQALKGDAA